MQRSKARGLGGCGLLSLFCFPVFALGLGCFPELRLFRAVVDLLVGRSARLPARVFVQVVEHLAQDCLEGAESRADRRRAEAMSDQTVREGGRDERQDNDKPFLFHSGVKRRKKSAVQLGFVRFTEAVQISFFLFTCRETFLSLHYGASNPPKRASLVELTPVRAEF